MEIGEFDAEERLFMKNKCVCANFDANSLNDNSKNKKAPISRGMPKMKIKRIQPKFILLISKRHSGENRLKKTQLMKHKRVRAICD
ncbi:MAG TPA: hypothetical protein VFH95_05990 [Candidatus Kapabacteria bacterium]|nr:hypothetical protein [Candidatus Kapabacteria bacterium]